MDILDRVRGLASRLDVLERKASRLPDYLTNWTDYSATLTGVTLGTGATTDYRHKVIDDVCFVHDVIVLGTGGSVTGSVTLDLPFTPVGEDTGHLWFEGTAQVGAGTGLYLVKWRWNGSSTQGLQMASSGTTQFANLSSTAPFTFAAGSILTRRGFYEI